MRSHSPASPIQHNPYSYSRPPTSRQKKKKTHRNSPCRSIPGLTRTHTTTTGMESGGFIPMQRTLLHLTCTTTETLDTTVHSPSPSAENCWWRLDKATDLAAGSPPLEGLREVRNKRRDNRRRLIALIFGVARRHKSTICYIY